MLERYTNLFSGLRTDRGRDRYPVIANHRAPHKPFLLLSVMDLIAEGLITQNFIEPSLELVDTFNRYWSAIMLPGSKTSMAYPFPRLKTDAFWHLVPKPGHDIKYTDGFRSMIKLREICAGAKMDDELFALMVQPETRGHLRMVLINTYFAPEIRPVLIKQGKVNVAAYQYSLDLLQSKGIHEHPGEWVNAQDPEVASSARNQGFRKAIVQLYDHRCALCGIRILTPEGHTIVEAAHIRSWSESRDDRPTNGLALCRLCHWSFDEGLMGVGQGYEVLVSKRVRTDQNMPGHMLTLADRPIFRPSDQPFWPDQDNLSHHRRQTFKN
jgi:putative restriction endonuclease